jgi:hypothetical protein
MWTPPAISRKIGRLRPRKLFVNGLLVLLLVFGMRSCSRLQYAHGVFSGLVVIDDVLASRKHHPLFGETWDCTYAIVALTDAAPQRPPSPKQITNWKYRFGGDWAPTPAPPLGDTTRDALSFCSEYFAADVASRLRTALTTPGSWYVRDGVGENLYIYAPKQDIAAKIRFGD